MLLERNILDGFLRMMMLFWVKRLRQETRLFGMIREDGNGVTGVHDSGFGVDEVARLRYFVRVSVLVS